MGHPNPGDYDRWHDKGNYKYALLYEGNLYPPKKIMSLATGIPTRELWGGDPTNRHFKRNQFSIIPKRIVRPQD
jgi:hypothetical protein